MSFPFLLVLDFAVIVVVIVIVADKFDVIVFFIVVIAFTMLQLSQLPLLLWP